MITIRRERWTRAAAENDSDITADIAAEKLRADGHDVDIQPGDWGASYTADTFAALARNIAESERAVAAHDTGAYARLNREFHLLMCDTPHTPWTMRLTSSLTAQTSAQRRGFDAIPHRLRASLAEHRAILATLRQGDTRRAASLLVEHERKAGAALIAALSDQRRAAE